MTGAPVVRSSLWRVLGRPLFRMTPYAAFGMRRRILGLFGARLQPSTKVRRSVRIDRPWNLSAGERTAIGDRAALRALEPIQIGDRCTISQLCIVSTETIDPATRTESITGPIRIEDDAWVAADSLVMPGVTVHTGAVVGARSLVQEDVPAWTIAVGQPTRVLKERRFAAPEDAA